jgi:transcriptional regulator with XRE-family HTH domain
MSDMGESFEVIREKAREMREVEGLEFAEIAERLGVTTENVAKWGKRDKWSAPRIIRHIVAHTTKVKANLPSTQAALSQLFKQDKVTKEKAFDEHLHDIACAVPLVVKQLTVDDWVNKADKIARLVTMAREILGRTGGDKEQRPLVSIGVLSSSCQPLKSIKAQLVELEQDTSKEHTG